MKYDIEVSKQAVKGMTKIPKRELLRIQHKIEALAGDPRACDVKKIQSDNNLYRDRSGNYRILYRIFDESICILIVDVDHRKDIYKDL